jgi:hypothetical protein
VVGSCAQETCSHSLTATGSPLTYSPGVIAFLQFNEELPRGTIEAKLQIFGKLVHDSQAGSPFVLRDVEGFLLRDGGHPDRELMAMLPGDVYTTKSYPLSAFSDAEWQSEEKTRHVEHYKEEIKNAQEGLDKEKAGEQGPDASPPQSKRSE